MWDFQWRGTISSIVGGWKFEREKSDKDKSESSGPKTLVLRLGNVIMGDEGVGDHVVRALEGRAPYPNVEYLDGGMGGFVLLGPMQAVGRIIMIDAAADGNPTGTVTRTAPRFVRDYPPTLTAHDIGIKDLLDRPPNLAMEQIVAELVGSVKPEEALVELPLSKSV